MSDAAAETLVAVVERELPFPPEKVWRALTQQHLLEEWLMKNDFQAVVGHKFELRGDWGGVLACEVLAIDPHKMLSYSWHFPHDDPAYDTKTVVTLTLTPTVKGTQLRVEHAGFRKHQKQAYGGAKAGWARFLGNLENILAKVN